MANTFVAGDDITLTITATDQDGDAIDLTGASITWGLKKKLSDSSVTLTKSTGGSGVTITNATSGIFTVALDAADTTGLSGDYIHESKITDAATKIGRLREADVDPSKITFKQKIVS